MTQAICDYQRGRRIDRPLYAGKDTHALSEPAHGTALEVLASNGVETIIQRDDGFADIARRYRQFVDIFERAQAG